MATAVSRLTAVDTRRPAMSGRSPRSRTLDHAPPAVTELPRIENGYAHAMTGPGLGTALVPGLRTRVDATVQRTARD
jgi:hypothetical protein